MDVGRDLGKDEGREQAQWRDLVARLELQPSIDPAEKPWPDRENLRAEAQPDPAGPRDYELDEPREGDLDEEDDRYIPPPLPPQPGLDPVAKGAWLALFGGPGYLLVATLLSWQIPGWAALTAVVAFVAGFVVLVFRLGDGPSKRDGPDQGAVV